MRYVQVSVGVNISGDHFFTISNPAPPLCGEVEPSLLLLRPLLAYCTSRGLWSMTTSVEQSVECLARETKVGENLLQCRFVYHKSHMTSPGHRGGNPATNRLSYGTAVSHPTYRTNRWSIPSSFGESFKSNLGTCVSSSAITHVTQSQCVTTAFSPHCEASSCTRLSVNSGQGM
jgi:hypothetical protein